MRTRAQQARDSALTRLTRVNRSLTAAALIGTAVLVDVIAQTPLGHAATARRALTRSTATGGTTLRRANTPHLTAPTSERLESAPAPKVRTTSRPPAAPSPAASPAPATSSSQTSVVVSGGS